MAKMRGLKTMYFFLTETRRTKDNKEVMGKMTGGLRGFIPLKPVTVARCKAIEAKVRELERRGLLKDASMRLFRKYEPEARPSFPDETVLFRVTTRALEELQAVYHP